ncbi:hypothetical protein [Streptomyces sp. NPDC020362]|uniref:hypothetical protein n=1 Tax=unclassified Streptomyces TaxID=2593676 RepID=UPI000A8357EB
MATTYASAAELAAALRRAAEAHGRHEEEIGHADPDWPDWYARFMVEEQPRASEDAPPG